MADQQTDAFSCYPAPLQDELRGLDKVSKSLQRRARFFQELFAAVLRDDQYAAQVMLKCLYGRIEDPRRHDAVLQNAMMLVRPVAKEVKLRPPTDFPNMQAGVDLVVAMQDGAYDRERLGAFERMHDPSTFRSAHDAIGGLTVPVSLAMMRSMEAGPVGFSKVLEDWGWKFSGQQWTVFKRALDVAAKNDVATIRKTLDVELTQATERAKTVFFGGVRDAPATVIDDLDEHVGERANLTDGSADDGLPRSKRSTEKGEARVKIIATWSLHHQYQDGGALNFEPIGANELARQADVSQGSTSAFFTEVFDGHTKYKTACHVKRPLLRALKEQNGDFSPEPQYDPALLDDRVEDDADRWDQREREGG
jgi:hypothetical protein